MNKRKSATDSNTSIRLFLPLFLSLVLAVAGLTALIYYFEVRNERSIIETHGKNNLVLMEEIIANNFKVVISDLYVLSTLQEVNLLLEDPSFANKELLAKEFLTFSLNKGIYDQIRFLDKDGMEIIRVNYNDGEPYIVPQEKLQSKGGRYYFQETLQLEEGKVYVSPFDLNIEEGKIEQPLKPMIRFGIPIFDNKGEKQGIIVTNYLGAHLTENLRKLLSYELSQAFLINSDGYWLMGSSPEDEWGFMFEGQEDKKFERAFPQAWTKLEDTESGQFYTSEGLFTFKNVDPILEAQRAALVNTNGTNNVPSESREYYWKIVNYVSPEVLNAQPLNVLRRLLVIDGFLIIIIGIGAWLLTRAIAQRRAAEKKVFELNKILRLLNKILRHDILNDLAVVRDSIDMYQEQKDSGLINNVSTAAQRSIKLIGRMRELELAISSGEKLKSYQARQVVNEVREKFPKMNIKIKGNGRVMGDQALFSAIENAVRNAKMHGKTDKVDILIKEKGNFVEIRIADYGTGIPDEIKNKLFVEGFKYGKTGHSGLGLYIMRKTIERYGGEVRIEDNKPKGAVFVLSLPKAKQKNSMKN